MHCSQLEQKINAAVQHSVLLFFLITGKQPRIILIREKRLRLRDYLVFRAKVTILFDHLALRLRRAARFRFCQFKNLIPILHLYHTGKHILVRIKEKAEFRLRIQILFDRLRILDLYLRNFFDDRQYLMIKLGQVSPADLKIDTSVIIYTHERFQNPRVFGDCTI